jgi:hypothetical protein
MKKKQNSQTELISLNNDFYSEYSIQELELRLETDPLLFANFFQHDMMANGSDDITCSVAGALVLCTGSGTTLNHCSSTESLIASN